MRKTILFLAVLLILVGVVLLLDTMGYLGEIDAWKLIGPGILIGLGLWVLLGFLLGQRAGDKEEVSIPLEGAREAHLQIDHGAGRLRLGAGADPDRLAIGSFGGGLDHRMKREGDELYVEMRPPGYLFLPPWGWGRGMGFEWMLHLNGEIPLSLDLDTGASEVRLDLTDLRVVDLQLDTAASSTQLTLPANAGHTDVEIEAGAASVAIRVPPDVAARIQIEGGLSSIDVDQGRFPRTGAGYQSPDYETAVNKVDMDIEVGVGSVKIR